MRDKGSTTAPGFGIGRSGKGLIACRGNAARSSVGLRCDDYIAPRDHEFHVHRVTSVVQTQRAGGENKRATKRRIIHRRIAATKDDDRASRRERCPGGEGESIACGVSDDDARQIDRVARVVEQLNKLIIIRVAHAIAVSVAIDGYCSRVVRSDIRVDLVDDQWHLNIQVRCSRRRAA